ncbi:MAG: radical SAM protein [Saprospirales bacterium]|nr:radical SAM protein [Saprospirales bacterium]
MVKEVKSGLKTELPLEALPSPIITDSWKRRRLLVRFFTRLAGRIVRETGSIPRTIQVLRALRARHHEARAFNLFGKLAEVEGRVFWHLASGGAPSAAAQKVIGQEISRILYPDKPVGLRVLMLAITKKCPLSCEHCYEGDYLQGEEVLSRADLQEIIRQYQEAGTPVIWLGGGEPMVRIRDVRFLLRHAAPGTDFWIVTSGYRLNEQTAKGLKADGLTGVVVSLDHFDATMHNRFRGSDRAFDWAVQACISAKKAGLVTAVSICATREFTTEDNFRKYMDLAKQLGVAFVQLLEPKASGRYAGKDVALSKTR